MPQTEIINGQEVKVFFWKRQKRYRCPLVWEGGAACEFDTYDVEMLGQHMIEPHTFSGKIPRNVKRVSPILNSKGEQIMNETPIPHDLANVKFKE